MESVQPNISSETPNFTQLLPSPLQRPHSPAQTPCSFFLNEATTSGKCLNSSANQLCAMSSPIVGGCMSLDASRRNDALELTTANAGQPEFIGNDSLPTPDVYQAQNVGVVHLSPEPPHSFDPQSARTAHSTSDSDLLMDCENGIRFSFQATRRMQLLPTELTGDIDFYSPVANSTQSDIFLDSSTQVDQNIQFLVAHEQEQKVPHNVSSNVSRLVLQPDLIHSPKTFFNEPLTVVQPAPTNPVVLTPTTTTTGPLMNDPFGSSADPETLSDHFVEELTEQLIEQLHHNASNLGNGNHS
jgi:hypothetical protein